MSDLEKQAEQAVSDLERYVESTILTLPKELNDKQIGYLLEFIPKVRILMAELIDNINSSI